MLDFSLDISNRSASEPKSFATFELGESYNARIAALLPCETTFKASPTAEAETKRGFVLVLLVEDAEGVKVWKQSRFYSLERSIFHEKASFAILMRSLLKVTDSGEALKQKIIEAGLGDLVSIVDMPCVVTMGKKAKDDKEFWNIETIRGCSSSFKGLQSYEGATALDISKVVSKFLTLYDKRAISSFITLEAANDNKAVDTDALNANTAVF